MKLIALALLAGLLLIAAAVWFFIAVCVPEKSAIPLMVGWTLQVAGAVALLLFFYLYRAEPETLLLELRPDDSPAFDVEIPKDQSHADIVAANLRRSMGAEEDHGDES